MPCPRCGRPAPPAARFCPACGAPLAASRGTLSGLLEAAAPAPEALEGERKLVTVLFADVKGSLELLADRDPEEMWQVLEQVLEHMREAVRRYEGTVAQVLGDGLMALFGAPVAWEDHAVRACYAALRMQERVEAYGDAMQRSLGVPLQIRVGLASGEVLVRAVGADPQTAYLPVGQTVHLAARMEQTAKPGSVLATGATVALARDRVRTRPLGRIPVKGLADPVDVSEVTGTGPARSRVDAPAASLAPFTDRESEMTVLGSALRAAAERGQVVAVVGDAGVGKSRLLREFGRLCRGEGWLVLDAVCVPYGRAAAHRPGLELMRRFFALDAGDDAATVRQKVTARMLALDPGLEEAIPPMLWLLGGLRPGSPFLALGPEGRRRRGIEAVIALVRRLARTQPVALLFEDLQWVDSETQASLDGLVAALPPRSLVLVSYRPEYGDRWVEHPGWTRVRLDDLPPAEARRMLEVLLGADPALAGLVERLLERTGGNPLFLEECVRALVEAGALAGERGRYRAGAGAAGVEVPATVRAVIEARIDRLGVEPKRLLQAAAVIGEEIPAALLEAIADLPPEALRRGLQSLCSAELLDEVGLYPDAVYVFRHAIVHEVAYEGVLHDRRRALHTRIVDALERLGPEERAEEVDRLAEHAWRGEAWDRAVPYLREAGRRSVARLATREGVAALERALEALGHLPETDETRALGIDLRFDLYDALAPLGAHERILATLREAEQVARALGDDGRLGRVLALLSSNGWNMGDSDVALGTGREALGIAQRRGDPDLLVIASFGLGGAVRALGDYRAAVGYLRAVLRFTGGERALQTYGLAGLASVLARGHLAWSLAELGEFAEAIGCAEEAIRTAEAAGHPYSLAHALLGLGGALVRQGRLGAAMGVLERGLALSADAPVLYPPVAGDLAVVYAVSGRTARALELAAEAVRRADRMSRLGRLSLITTHLGEVSLLAGDAGAARAAGTRALELARRHAERGNEVYAHRLLGLVAAQRTPPDTDTARRHYADAIALAETLGMRPLLARCHLGLGRLARVIGEAKEADRQLALAGDLLRTLGMSYWLERLDLDRVGPPAAA